MAVVTYFEKKVNIDDYYQNLPFSQNTSQGPSLIFGHNQDKCTYSGSYSKISSPAQLYDIVKF